MELTEGRVLLREFVDQDVGALLAIHADPRLLRYYAPEVGTLDHTRMLIDIVHEMGDERPRHNFQFAIVDRASNALLGSCGVRRKGCLEGQAEFGIGIDANWWGRGIAPEAAKLILRFGFSELALREIRGVAFQRMKRWKDSRADLALARPVHVKASRGWWNEDGRPWIG